MPNFDDIRAVLAPELESMNTIIRRALCSDNNLMDSIVEYYLKVKGKQIRPIMVLLSARMFGQVNNHVLHAGAALEMLHNASLIHDDVVDDTRLRRDRATLNARWDNRIAVLVGDFFVSNSLAVGISTNNLEIISTISSLGRELSLGEINQICNVREHAFDEESYLKMIGQKTASLFTCCAKMGAEAVGASPEQYEPLMRFAHLLGLCFQIRDDIFDYFDDSEIGKPTGNDLREGKVTLPLLYALKAAPESESQRIKEILLLPELTSEQIEECLHFAIDNGGIEYAQQKMESLCHDAEMIIDEYTDSETRQAFKSLFRHIITRTN